MESPTEDRTKEALSTCVKPRVLTGSNKVTVVGAGASGMACAFSIITQGVTAEICLIDCQEDKVKGEMLDLLHGSIFLRNVKVTASSDYSVSAGSRICIICAGACSLVTGMSRLDIVKKNNEMMKEIIPPLVLFSPDTIILVVSNPVDILTYVAWKLSGLPKQRVIGSGTNLDTSRFRWYLAQRLDLAPTNCEGWIIGEHGDSSVAVWSGVNVAGTRLVDLNPLVGADNDPEKWIDIHKQVQQSAHEVLNLKGRTNWAIAMTVTAMVRSIINNVGDIHAASVHARGHYGVTCDVYLSLPVVLGADGVTHIVKQKLTPEEREALNISAKVIEEVQNQIHF